MRKLLFVLLFVFLLSLATLPVSVAQASSWCGKCSTLSTYDLSCGDWPCDDFHRTSVIVEKKYRGYYGGRCVSYCSTVTYYYCTQDNSCGGVRDIGCETPVFSLLENSAPSPPPSDHDYTLVWPHEISQAERRLVIEALLGIRTADEARQILSTNSTLPSWAGNIQVYDP